MDSKKFNIFTIVFAVLVCGLSIFISLTNGGRDGTNGTNGKSAYEEAVDNGFNGSVTEWLNSLHGADGEDLELEDLYSAYLTENSLTSSDYTYSEFITEYFSNMVTNSEEAISLTELATQSALRSTVDIVYSFCLDKPMISVSSGTLTSTGEDVFIINSQSYASTGVSAGSGVIYQMDSDTAYIITNYHVVYAANYTDDSKYRVYYVDNSSYYVGTYDETMVNSTSNGWLGSTNYIKLSDIEEAPIYTHFLDSYEIYLYGYQSAEYAISATFVGGSADNDIAVLKIERDATENNEILFGGNYKAVDLGDSSELSVGEGIIAVGNPLLADTSSVEYNNDVFVYIDEIHNSYIDALCLTSTDGVVSNTSEYCNFESIIDSSEIVSLRLIRVSSAINAGNSGGGLYDTNGRLVGIVNGKIESSSYDNVGYAIPINIASRLADQIIAQCEGSATETQVKVVTTESLGVTVSTGERNANYNSTTLSWEFDNAVTIDSVSLIGTAGTAGLEVNDIIDSVVINGVTHEINFDYELNDLLLDVMYGDTANYEIVFNIKRMADNVLTDTQVTILLDDANFVYID